MSKLELKAAMESLEVKLPFKLAAGPRFVAPTSVPAGTMVPGETPVSTPTMVPTETLVSATTKVGVGEHQNSAVALESFAAAGLSKGYTRLPNNVLMKMAQGELLRSEIQILLLIARFTISFQRRHAPLSKAVLERRSGLRGPAVLQAISDLVAKGLIEKIPGDQHRPNQLGLVFDEEWDFFGSEKKTMVPGATQVSVGTVVPVQTMVAVPTPAGVPAATQTLVPGGTYFKDTKTIKNKLSLSEIPEVLQKYFSELKPARKRESEMVAFEELLGDFSPADICACFDVVRVRGVNGDPCHSPMAYLSKAIGGVMPEVIEQRKKIQERQEREMREAEETRRLAEVEAEESADWAAKKKSFLDAYPDEHARLAKIHELIAGRGFRPNTEIGMRMAISKWARR